MSSMTPERLSKVATAAGFAMATHEDFTDERTQRNEAAAWRVVESKLHPTDKQAGQQSSAVSTAAGWIRGAIGSFGRGATA
jgi:hypothetical protein